MTSALSTRDLNFGDLSTSTLPAIDPVTYARGHDLFEARSNQRELITTWMHSRLDARSGTDDLSFLSVGCGNGAVDAQLARRACRRSPGGARRHWSGIDPHAPNVADFAARLDGLERSELTVESHACTFGDFRTDERFDVMAFVHSLYYVDDLADALTTAISYLNTGGELLIAHAPLGALNTLSAALAPPVAGRPQPWSGTVAAELIALGAAFTCAELDAVVDLTGCADEDPALLDFAVQAHLDDAHRAGVVEALSRIAEPDPGLRVAHPVTVFSVSFDGM